MFRRGCFRVFPTKSTSAPVLAACCLTVAWAIFPAQSVAQPATSKETCQQIKHATDRLACYDGLYPPFEQPKTPPPPETNPVVTAPSREVPPPSPSSTHPKERTSAQIHDRVDRTNPKAGGATENPAPPPRPTVTPTTPETEETFGYSVKPEKTTTKLKQISATVTAVNRKWPDNRYVYDLDNGQRWEQTKTQRTTIRKGDRITIKKGRLGGYLIANERGASARVTRVSDG